MARWIKRVVVAVVAALGPLVGAAPAHAFTMDNHNHNHNHNQALVEDRG